VPDFFRLIYGRAAEVSASAPGRVNLIGEHTDYNGGYVLPKTLPQETHVSIARRSDRAVRAASADLQPGTIHEFELGRERRNSTWLDYLQGVTWAIGERGISLQGFDCTVSSTVPIGKGLSSSAALEIGVARVLRKAYRLSLTDVDLAMIGHRAETGFVGAPVGIMDQMVCSLGDSASAFFLDAATAKFENIALPEGMSLGVIDSGIEHHHASGDYRVRRRECEEAAARLGVHQLRELSPADLPRVARLPEPLNRRARHVITENDRVLSAVDAIRRKDLRALGALFLASHASMRDDFDVSLPDIDTLVSLAAEDADVLGARLTGGGFGGSIVMVCAGTTAGAATGRALERYRRQTNRRGEILLPTAAAPETTQTAQ
jgi:galactokinase